MRYFVVNRLKTFSAVFHPFFFCEFVYPESWSAAGSTPIYPRRTVTWAARKRHCDMIPKNVMSNDWNKRPRPEEATKRWSWRRKTKMSCAKVEDPLLNDSTCRWNKRMMDILDDECLFEESNNDRRLPSGDGTIGKTKRACSRFRRPKSGQDPAV